MGSFADVHYCSNADIVAGSEKAQGYVEVIYGCPKANTLVYANIEAINYQC